MGKLVQTRSRHIPGPSRCHFVKPKPWLMSLSTSMRLPTSPATVRASMDTPQSLPHNPRRTHPKPPPQNANRSPSTPISQPYVNPTIRENLSVSALLHRELPGPRKDEEEKMYLGYETWMPSAPKVEKPHAVYNAAALAYAGYCIYELYARRHFLFPPLRIEEYNDRAMAVVRCEAQDAVLTKLLKEDLLSEEERDVLRWGKNSNSTKGRTKKRVGAAAYNRASSLETLVGFLYLTYVKRLDEIMVKLGFSSDSSNRLNFTDANGNKESVLVVRQRIYAIN